MLALFASKTYALLKYGILSKKSSEPEKIYIQAPEHHYPSYFEDDHSHESHDFTSSGSYGRGFQTEIYDNYNLVQDLIKKYAYQKILVDTKLLN